MKLNKLSIQRIAVLAVSILILAGVGKALIAKKKAALSKTPKFKLEKRPIETLVVQKGPLTEVHDYLAVIEPSQTANVSAQVTASVLEILKFEGEQVKAGDSLAKLDDQQIEDSIAVIQGQILQTKAEGEANDALLSSLKQTVNYWKNERDRDAKLADSETITHAQAQLSAERYNEAYGKLQTTDKKSEVIQQQVKVLEHKINELKTKLAYYQVKSPFDGVISSRIADKGDLATPGKPLFTVEDRGQAKVSFDVPQEDLTGLKLGTEVSFEYAGKTYTSKITTLYPKLNSVRMLRAEAVLTPTMVKEIPLGAYVNLKVTLAKYANAVLVPIDSLLKVNGKQLVYTVVDGKLKYRQVKVLGIADGQAAIEGIEPGTTVVLNLFLGWAKLANGIKVEVN